MTRITIEIPEWAENRHIYVMAGIELLAYKNVGGPLRIKTGRCKMCGKCCVFRDGPCEHLVPNGQEKVVCDLGSGRPWSCGVSRNNDMPDCTETYEDA